MCVLIYPIGINVAFTWLPRQTRFNRAGSDALELPLDAYSPRFYFWEIVDNARRLSLTGLLVFVSESSRVLLASLFALLFLMLYGEAQPFANVHDNALQNSANAGITLTFLLVLANQADASKPETLGLIAAAMAVAVIPAVVHRHLAYLHDRHALYTSLEPRRELSGALLRQPNLQDTFDRAIAAGPQSEQAMLDRLLRVSRAASCRA